MVSYFKMNHSLKKHGFSIDEIDNMLPYEREAYILMIESELKEKSQQNNSNQVDIP